MMCITNQRCILMNFQEIDQKATDILIKKNNAYGNAYAENFSEFGIVYSAIEINNKTRRIIHLTKNNKTTENKESLFDSYLDLRNYAELAIQKLVETGLAPQDWQSKDNV